MYPSSVGGGGGVLVSVEEWRRGRFLWKPMGCFCAELENECTPLSRWIAAIAVRNRDSLNMLLLDNSGSDMGYWVTATAGIEH